MFEFFLTDNDGSYGLTAPGYIAVALAAVALVVLVSCLGKTSKTIKAKQLAFSAMAIALASVTSIIKVYSFPFGGSVTLLSMLFICLIGYWYGPKMGIMTGAAYGIIQLILEPFILFPMQVLVDYLLAFGALGLSGLFWKKKNGLVKGYITGISGRYIFSVLSGWLFFGAYAWEGWNPLAYSLVYNGCYIFAEGLITVIIISIPSVSKALMQVKHQSS